MTIALLVVAAGAAIGWLVGHNRWGFVQKLIFWLVVAVVVWILVALFGVPQPSG